MIYRTLLCLISVATLLQAQGPEVNQDLENLIIQSLHEPIRKCNNGGFGGKVTILEEESYLRTNSFKGTALEAGEKEQQTASYGGSIIDNYTWNHIHTATDYEAPSILDTKSIMDLKIQRFHRYRDMGEFSSFGTPGLFWNFDINLNLFKLNGKTQIDLFDVHNFNKIRLFKRGKNFKDTYYKTIKWVRLYNSSNQRVTDKDLAVRAELLTRTGVTFNFDIFAIDSEISAGRLKSVVNRNGYALNINYVHTPTEAVAASAKWKVASISDPHNRSITVSYLNEMRKSRYVVEKITLPTGEEITYDWGSDSDSELQKVLYPNGDESSFSTGAENNLVTKTYNEVTAKPKHKRKVVYLTNDVAHLIASDNSVDKVKYFNQASMLVRYIKNGNGELTYAGIQKNNNAMWRYIYDGGGRLKELDIDLARYFDSWDLLDPSAGSDGYAGVKEETYYHSPYWHYSANRKRRPNRLQLPDGRIIKLRYNRHKALVKKIFPNGEVEKFKYDPYQNLLEIKHRSGEVSLYQYDDLGNILKAETGLLYEVGGNMVGQELQGLQYRYFESEFNSLPDFTSLSPDFVGSVSEPSLDVVERDNRFALQYVGEIEITEAGTYEFSTTSDDGSKLIINGQVVVDNDGLHSSRKVSGSIDLTTGKHQIEVQYFERTGNEQLVVTYNGLDTDNEEIPLEGEALSHIVTDDELVVLQSPNYSITEYEYYPAGHKDQHLLKLLSVDGAKQKFSYNDNHLLEFIHDVDSDGVETLAQTFGWDSAGRLISHDAGELVNFEYDSRNRLTAKRYPDTQESELFFYGGIDQNFRLVQRKLRNGVTEKYSYDTSGRLAEKVSPYSYMNESGDEENLYPEQLRNKTLFTYIRGSSLVKTKIENGIITDYTYDPRGRIKTSQTKAGTLTQVSTFSYKKNKLFSVVNSDGSTKYFSYDSQNGLNHRVVFAAPGADPLSGFDAVSQLDRNAGALYSIIDYELNEDGKQVAIIDPNGNRIETSNPEFPRLTDPDNHSTFTSSSQIFSFTESGADSYKLFLGTFEGSGDLAMLDPKIDLSEFHAEELPEDGTKIYARLIAYYGTNAVYSDYVFDSHFEAVLPSPPVLENAAVIVKDANGTNIKTAKELSEDPSIPSFISNIDSPNVPVISPNTGDLTISGPRVADYTLVDVEAFIENTNGDSSSIFKATRTGDEDLLSLPAPFFYRFADRNVFVEVQNASLPTSVLTSGINYLTLRAKDKEGLTSNFNLELGTVNDQNSSMLLFDDAGPAFTVDNLDNSQGTPAVNSMFLMTGQYVDLTGISNIEVLIDGQSVSYDSAVAGNNVFILNFRTALAQLALGNHTFEFRFTDLTGNVSTQQQEFNYTGSPYDWTTTIVEDSDGNPVRDSQGRLQFFNTVKGFTAQEVTSMTLDGVEVTTNSQGVDEKSLVISSSAQSPLSLEGLEAGSGIDTQAPGLGSAIFIVTVKPSSFGENDAPLVFTQVINWDNEEVSNLPPEVSSFFPLQTKFFTYEESNPVITIDDMIINYSDESPGIAPEKVVISLLDGTDITEKFTIYSNQAVLKADTTFDVPVQDNTASIKVFLEEVGSDNPLTSEKIIHYRAVTEENIPALGTGEIAIQSKESYLVPLYGENLEDVSQVELVRNYSPDVVYQTLDVVDYKIIDGKEVIFVKVDELRSGSYFLKVGGRLQKGFDFNSTSLFSGVSTSHDRDFDPITKSNITLTTPLAGLDNKLHTSSLWTSVTGYTDVEIKDAILTVNGQSIHASHSKLSGRSSFIFGNVPLIAGLNSVNVFINKKANNSWERSATFEIYADLNDGLDAGDKDSPFELNFNPESPIITRSGLYKTITVNGEELTRSDYDISGRVFSKTPLDRSSFKVIIDGDSSASSSMFDIVETKTSEGINIYDFSLKANRYLSIRRVDDVPQGHVFEVVMKDIVGRSSSVKKSFSATRGPKFRVLLSGDYTRNQIPNVGGGQEIFDILYENLVDLTENRIIAHSNINVDPESYNLKYEGVDLDNWPLYQLLDDDGNPTGTIVRKPNKIKKFYEKYNHQGIIDFTDLTSYEFGLPSLERKLNHYLVLGGGENIELTALYEGDIETIAQSSTWLNSRIQFRAPSSKTTFYQATYNAGEVQERRIVKVTVDYDSNNGTDYTTLYLPQFIDKNNFLIKSDLSGDYYLNATVTFEQLAELPPEAHTRNTYKIIKTINDEGDINYSVVNLEKVPPKSYYPFSPVPLEMYLNESAILNYTPPPTLTDILSFSLTESNDYNSKKLEIEYLTGQNASQPGQIRITGKLPTILDERGTTSYTGTDEPSLYRTKSYEHVKAGIGGNYVYDVPIRVKGFTVKDRRTFNYNFLFGLGETYDSSITYHSQSMEGNKLKIKAELDHHTLYNFPPEFIQENCKLMLNGEEIPFKMVINNALANPKLSFEALIEVNKIYEGHRLTFIGPEGERASFLIDSNLLIHNKTLKTNNFSAVGQTWIRLNQYGFYFSDPVQMLNIFGEYDNDQIMTFTNGDVSKNVLMRRNITGKHRLRMALKVGKAEYNKDDNKAELYIKPGDTLVVSSDRQSSIIPICGSIFEKDGEYIDEVYLDENGVELKIKNFSPYSSPSKFLIGAYNANLSNRLLPDILNFNSSDFQRIGNYAESGGIFESPTIVIKPYQNQEKNSSLENGVKTYYLRDGDYLVVGKAKLKVHHIKGDVEKPHLDPQSFESLSGNSISKSYPVELPWFNASADVMLNNGLLKFNLGILNHKTKTSHLPISLTYRSNSASEMGNPIDWHLNMMSRIHETRDGLIYTTSTGMKVKINKNAEGLFEVPAGLQATIYVNDYADYVIEYNSGTKMIFRKFDNSHLLYKIEDKYGNAKTLFNELGDDSLSVFDEGDREFQIIFTDGYSARERRLIQRIKSPIISSLGEHYFSELSYYEDSQLLKSVRSRHGALIRFHYDDLNRLTKVYAQDEFIPQVEVSYYGDSFKVKEIIREGKFKDEYSYSGSKTNVTDHHQIQTEYEFYTDKPLVKSITEKGSQNLKTQFSYDDEHRLTSRVSPEGIKTSYEYWVKGTPKSDDKRGYHLVKSIEVVADSLRGNGDVVGNFTDNLFSSYTYSTKYFQLEDSTGPDGVTVKRRYKGNSTEDLETITYFKQDGSTVTESFSFNEFGQLTSHESVDGLVKTFEYYKNDENYFFNYTFEKFEGSIAEPHPLNGYLYKTSFTGSDGVTHTVITPRDSFGRATSIISSTSGSDGENRSLRKDFYYTERGELEKQVEAPVKDNIEKSRAYTEYSYDSRGRLLETRHFNPVHQNGDYTYIQSKSNSFYDAYGRLSYTISPVQNNQNRVDYFYKDGETRINAVKSESGSYTHYSYDEYGRPEIVVSNHDIETLDASNFSEDLLPKEALISKTEYNHDSQVMETESFFAGGESNTSVLIRDGFGRVVQNMDLETGYYSKSAFNKKGQLYETTSYSDTHKILGRSTLSYYQGDGSLKRTTDNITGTYSENAIDESINKVQTTLSAPGIVDPYINIAEYTDTGRLSNLNIAGVGFNPVTSHYGDILSLPPTGGAAIAPTLKFSSSGYPYEFTNKELNGTTKVEQSGFGTSGKITDSANKVTENRVDENGSAIASTEAKGESAQRTTHSYVNNAERISLLLRNDQLTETRYDLAGRVEEKRFYYGVIPSDLQTWTRASGDSYGAITTSTTYDSLGRIDEQTHKDGEVHRFTYYPRESTPQRQDRLKAIYKVLPGGTLKILRSFEDYNIFGQATVVREYSGGDLTCYEETVISYYGEDTGYVGPATVNGFGALKSSKSKIVINNNTSSPFQTLTMAYDPLGRVKSKTMPSGDVLGFKWDFTFAPKQITLNSANLITYDRNSPYKGNTTGKSVLNSINISKTYNSHSAGLIDQMAVNSEVFVDYSNEQRGLKDSIKQWNSNASSVAYDGCEKKNIL